MRYGLCRTIVKIYADYELYNELCDEKRFTKHPAGGLSELRHALGDGLFTAKFGEYNWEVAHRVLVPAFGPLAIPKMFDGQFILRGNGLGFRFDDISRYARARYSNGSEMGSLWS